MSFTSILRLSPSEDALSILLRDALVSHSSFDNDTLNIDEDNTPLLNISNRYFTAKVFLEWTGQAKVESKQPEDRKEDGMILVFSLANDDQFFSGQSFGALATFHDSAEQNGECGNLLRLCIGVSIGPQTIRESKKYEEEYSRRVLWCLDRGYEYIEADLSDEGKSLGFNEREKDGFARIVEAIEGTVWSSANMKQNKSTKIKALHNEDDKCVLTDNESCTPSTNYTSPCLNDENDDSNVDTDQDLKNEKIIDGLDNMLKEAGRIRDASKNSQFNDDDRKKHASDAAKMMMGLLEQMGVDSSDEDEYDSCDNDILDDGS